MACIHHQGNAKQSINHMNRTCHRRSSESYNHITITEAARVCLTGGSSSSSASGCYRHSPVQSSLAHQPSSSSLIQIPIENQIKIRPKDRRGKGQPGCCRPIRTGPPTPLQTCSTNYSPFPRSRHLAPKQEIAIAIANKGKPEDPPSPSDRSASPELSLFLRFRFCREGSTASTRTLCTNHFLFQTVPQISSNVRTRRNKGKKEEKIIISANPNPSPKIQSKSNF